MLYQKPLPDQYSALSRAAAEALIAQRKAELGPRLVILGHHYQKDDVIQFADFRGDSLALSQRAAEQSRAEYIVFCGVHFMAESADILTGPEQKVILPDLSAGCTMADMAEIDQVEEAWEHLTAARPERRIIPVTYVNSSAAIKAFCGANDGLSATSSNCAAVFKHVWGEHPDALILFMPDEHLGRNTAYALGVPREEMPLWDPFAGPDGGVSAEQLRTARILLWKGFCSVHQNFRPADVARVRAEDPAARIIVHPECCFEVVQAADESGSTARIINVVRAAAAGAHWAVGTEVNLVNRLAAEMAVQGVKVESLSTIACLCETMYRIDLAHLAWVMDNIAAHAADPQGVTLENRIVVDDATRADAVKALDRMLAVS